MPSLGVWVVTEYVKFVEGSTKIFQLGLSGGDPTRFAYSISTYPGSAWQDDFVEIDVSGGQSGIFSIPLTIIDDTKVELDEHFTLNAELTVAGQRYSFTYDITVTDNDAINCPMDYDGDGKQDFMEVSMTQAVNMLATLSSRQDLQRENTDILNQQIDALNEQQGYLSKTIALKAISFIGSVASLGVANTVSSLILAVSNIAATAYNQAEQGANPNESAKTGFIQSVELIEQLMRDGLKVAPIFGTIYSAYELHGDTQKFFDELAIIKHNLKTYANQVEATNGKLDRLIQAQRDLSECIEGVGARLATSLEPMLAQALDDSSTGYVPLLQATGGTYVGRGTGNDDLFDVRGQTSLETTVMLATTVGHDRLLVDEGSVFVDDDGGSDVVAVMNGAGHLRSIADVRGDGLAALEDAFLITAADLILTTRGVEYFEFREGRYALQDGALVKSNSPTTGTMGNDYFWADGGKDTYSGHEGIDTVLLTGNRSDYALQATDSGLTIRDKRSGSPDGIDILVDIEKLVFKDGTYSRDIVDLVNTADAAVVGSIIELYIAYLNRVPEADGLAYWIKQSQSGATLDQISAHFYEAGKSFTNVTGYSEATPLADFIELVYSNVLYRRGSTAPTDQEIEWWVDEVTSGREDIPGLIQRMISDSKVFADHPVYGAMSDYFENKVDVGYLHAVTYGIDYNSVDDIVNKANAIAEAVTPTNTSAAIRLMGMSNDMYLHDMV